MLWLCPKCTELNRIAIDKVSNTQHHSSYNALRLSAHNGCALCALFVTATLLAHVSTTGGTGMQAEEYQCRIDQDDAQNTEGTSRPFCVSVVGPGASGDTVLSNGLFEILYARPISTSDAVWLARIKPFITAFPPDGQLEQHVIGRRMPVRPDLSVAIEWLRICKETHSKCHRNFETWLPSKVIEVGSTNSDIRLRSDPALAGQYITLSHRWGEDKMFKTKSSNYEEHLKGIDYEALLKTFQDAIQVTRALGVPYLWIDALCFMQDSEDDWARACVEVSRIYGKALLNIGAPQAFHQNAGLLHDRHGHHSYPLGLEWPTGVGDEKLRFNLIYQSVDVTLQYNHWNSVLASRAWILQERLLAQRILYFGSNAMHWECNETQNFEPCGYSKRQDPSVRGWIDKISFEERHPQPTWLDYWYETIRSYSACHVTIANDRFPALSGVARMFQQILRDQYLAGLWEQDIVRGLN
ncbi:hypothetical protein LTS15_010373 [Exophiala xenobiotica]|nr:hypothetical protein LTS15_010373 [Exophiala xenobiotica]